MIDEIVDLQHRHCMHVVRPDRVYRTGVLTSIVGYQPQMDMQAVARAFTQGPPSGTSLQGLNAYYGFRGLNGGGWEGFKQRVRDFFARFKFNRAVAADASKNGVVISNTSPGPETLEAAVVAPQMQSQMAMLAHLTQSSNSRHARGPLAAAMFSLQNRRPFTYYRAG